MTKKRRRPPRSPGAKAAPERAPADEAEVSSEPEAEEAVVEVPVRDAADVAPEAPEASEETTSPPDAELAAARRIEELEDRLKRLQADFLNETKRIARQAEERRKFATESLVRDLLPVFDALHSAREGLRAAGGEDEAASDPTLSAVRQGLDLVEKELLNVLGRHGVERIEATASPFDPGLHEAVFVVDHPELKPNTVAQVLRPGFTLHGRVVRPVHVAVTRPRPEGAEAPEEEPPEGEPGADEE